MSTCICICTYLYIHDFIQKGSEGTVFYMMKEVRFTYIFVCICTYLNVYEFMYLIFYSKRIREESIFFQTFMISFITFSVVFTIFIFIGRNVGHRCHLCSCVLKYIYMYISIYIIDYYRLVMNTFIAYLMDLLQIYRI